MPTRRTPIRRELKRKITPEVLAAFRAMETADDDDAWWAAHSILHSGLGLPPWEWPAFEYPDAECPYPAGTEAAKHWQQNRDRRPHAFALYEELASSAGQ